MPDLTVEVADLVKQKALIAVRELDSIVGLIQDRCSNEESEIIRRGVGLSIRRIQTELLEPIFQRFPEINDLK
jgi:hypothetical protein